MNPLSPQQTTSSSRCQEPGKHGFDVLKLRFLPTREERVREGKRWAIWTSVDGQPPTPMHPQSDLLHEVVHLPCSEAFRQGCFIWCFGKVGVSRCNIPHELEQGVAVVVSNETSARTSHVPGTSRCRFIPFSYQITPRTKKPYFQNLTVTRRQRVRFHRNHSGINVS